ncbi:MAG: HAD family hydrolase [Chloroflexota bacterium]
MRYLALATDYDGTLAEGGRITPETLAALRELASSGRRLILNTGRNLGELFEVFDQVDIFDLVIAENGAVLYWPRSRRQRVLGAAPPAIFVATLRARGVSPLAVGEVSVSTSEEHMGTVVEVIHELGLGLQVVFNKDSAMIVPPNVNKATALAAALNELGLSLHNTVALGDGDNDIPAFEVAECAVAVANALPSLKQLADLVLPGEHGFGAQELVARLLATDLREVEPNLDRHNLLLGRADDGSDVRLHPYGQRALIVGPASGRTTVVAGLLDSLGQADYQICLVDPQGDYEGLAHLLSLGTTTRPPALEEILRVLEQPGQNVGVTLTGLSLADQATYFASLLSALESLQSRFGRPHVLVVAEAERLMPAHGWHSTPPPLRFSSVVLAAGSPEAVSPAALAGSDLVIAAAGDPAASITAFANALDERVPSVPWRQLDDGQAVAWFRRGYLPPLRFQMAAPPHRTSRQRRAFGGAGLGIDDSFYFHGPDGRLRLRAQNLEIFLQMAEGVDDETWLFHLRRGDYERWLRRSFGDEGLALEVEEARRLAGDDPLASRALVKRAIERRYAAA